MLVPGNALNTFRRLAPFGSDGTNDMSCFPYDLVVNPQHLLVAATCHHSRVVMVTSQSGMALVREASTTLSKPVRTKAPTLTSVTPMSGLAMRDARATKSRRAKIACREP